MIRRDSPRGSWGPHRLREHSMSRSRTRPLRGETRQRQFAAAATVFVRFGIAGASVEDICLEVGLTRDTLNSNFADKAELGLAMIEGHVDRSLAEIAASSISRRHPWNTCSCSSRRSVVVMGPSERSLCSTWSSCSPPFATPRTDRASPSPSAWREVIASIVRQDRALGCAAVPAVSASRRAARHDMPRTPTTRQAVRSVRRGRAGTAEGTANTVG